MDLLFVPEPSDKNLEELRQKAIEVKPVVSEEINPKAGTVSVDVEMNPKRGFILEDIKR